MTQTSKLTMSNFLRLCCLLLIGQLATAQGQSPSLSRDPVFSTVLQHRIHYPVSAERSGIYARIYAGFQVDQKGHIQQISILNPTKIGYGFEEEVLRKLTLLPPLHPKYEGAYALPVTFAIIDHTDRGKAVSPSGQLSGLFLSNRVVLNEIKIVGGKIPARKDKISPQSTGQILLNEQ